MNKTREIEQRQHQNIIKKITEIIIKNGQDKIAAVVLFGSFARGNWVYDFYQDGGNFYEYASDYDFLIASKSSGQKFNLNLQNKLKDKIRESRLTHLHKATIIVEPLKYINDKIEKSQYFFLDIKKEGKVLFQAEGFELAEPKSGERKRDPKEIAEDYKHWMARTDEAMLRFSTLFNCKKYIGAAFDLHQATESLYSCALLTLTGYKPKTHDLEELGDLCQAQNQEFLTIFPKNNHNISDHLIATENKKHRLVKKDHINFLTNSTKPSDWFELLKIAYIEARYNKDYQISKEQLEFLLARVEKLQALVEKIYHENLSKY